MAVCPIAEGARECPNQAALIADEKTWTYRELDGIVNAFCYHLQLLGVKKGDRIAFIAKTQWQSIPLFFAIFRLQAIACPLSFRLPQASLKLALERLRPCLFASAASIPLTTAPISFPDVEMTLPATLLFTSGSTNLPKIACHTLSNHIESARTALPFLKLTSGSRWLLSLPLFHVGGLAILFRCFLARAAVVFGEIASSQATHFSLVPTQMYRQLKEFPEVLSKASFILLGGAPISASLLRRLSGLPIATTYGMTEMSSLVTLDGLLLPQRHLSLSSDGELLTRGAPLFLGYWEKGAISSPMNSEGWFATKDLGKQVGNCWTILGRKDNLFISGGENIQPEEIECALLALPGILQAVVIPIDDAEFGARPAAFIEEIEPTYSLEAIQELLSDQLPRFKLPVRLFPLPACEGKINREVLKHYSQLNFR